MIGTTIFWTRFALDVAGGVGGPGRTAFGNVVGAVFDRPGSAPALRRVLSHGNRTFDRPNDSLHIGQRRVFIDRVVADHDVAFADQNRRADHRVPELCLAGDVRNDHLSDAAILGVLLHDDEPAGLAHRFLDRLAVPWRNRAEIDQLDARPVAQFTRALRSIFPSCCPRRPPSRREPGRWTRALPNDTARIGLADSCSAQRRCFGMRTKRWIFAMHRGPEQSGGVLRVARDGDVDPGIMGEGSLICLAMPETAAGQVSAVGRVDHERTGPGAKGAPAQVAKIRHDLVPGRADEVDELQFEDRPFAVGGQAAGDAHDR